MRHYVPTLDALLDPKKLLPPMFAGEVDGLFEELICPLDLAGIAAFHIRALRARLFEALIARLLDYLSPK
jgi:hypothetical protein